MWIIFIQILTFHTSVTVALWQPLQSLLFCSFYLLFSPLFKRPVVLVCKDCITWPLDFIRLPKNIGGMVETLFVNGRILSKTETGLNGTAHFSDSMLVRGDKIVAVGSRHDIAQGLAPDVEVHDLHQRVVLPGFIDGHMHLLLLGQSLRKLDLSGCKTLDDIRSCVRQYAVANPETPTILCKGWRHYMTPDGVTAAMLDDLDPRPIFIDAGSLHSCWCNTAALQELEVADMPDPAGGKIYRDADGKPSGLLDEGAMMSISECYISLLYGVKE